MSKVFFPPDDSRVRLVGSFEELVNGRFENGVNALCWPRNLEGDFSEVASLLEAGEGITTLDEEQLRALPASDAGRRAVDVLLEDLRLLREQDREPVLNCIEGYPRDEDPGPVATDVFSFHADSAPVEADTWLCTYHGACSEGVRNEEARRKVDVPEIRAELLALYDGEDDDGFVEFLSDYCYDLHYEPLPGARLYDFGLGNLWRIAVEWPGSPVPPCVHRAPDSGPGDPRRLLLIC